MKVAWTRVALAAVIVVLVIIIVVAWGRTRDAENVFTGFWTGEPAFLDRAGLREMYLYVAPRERRGLRWGRQGYLVMADADGNLISNQALELTYGAPLRRGLAALKSHFGDGRYEVPTLLVDCEEDEIIPSRLRMGLDATKGTLALYNNEKLFAFLTRDNETSLATAGASDEG